MKHNIPGKQWWGAPKKFNIEKEERKISWLELFYDLVYVIAISAITHRVATNFSIHELLDYLYLFVIIFWGWLNGSLYHDLHGSEGLRTKLMTLWQMAIVAALVIVLHSDSEHQLQNTTIVLLIMQLYITYLWWSVGLYDKEHRKLNRPYTIIYLITFLIIVSTLFVQQPFIRILFFVSLVFNCMPPFISHFLLNRKTSALNLSSSMTERLGLFTIIVFGEVVLGVINGVIAAHDLSASTWLEFILAISIVFALWWLFFTIISDRKCKGGLLNSSLFELLFIPTLIGLGLLGATFNDIFQNTHEPIGQKVWGATSLAICISLFLLGICTMMSLLDYPGIYKSFKRQAQWSILATAGLLFIVGFIPLQLSLPYFLLCLLLILVLLIVFLNGSWYRMMIKKNEKIKEQ